jgi:hypothetical protein
MLQAVLLDIRSRSWPTIMWRRSEWYCVRSWRMSAVVVLIDRDTRSSHGRPRFVSNTPFAVLMLSVDPDLAYKPQKLVSAKVPWHVSSSIVLRYLYVSQNLPHQLSLLEQFELRERMDP